MLLYIAGRKGSKKTNPSPSEAHSSDELTASLDNLQLLSPKKNQVQLRTLKTGAASALCDDAQLCSIEVVSRKKMESTRSVGEPQVDEVAPLHERLKTKNAKEAETEIREEISAGHIICSEDLCLAEQLKVEMKDIVKGTAAKLEHDVTPSKHLPVKGAHCHDKVSRLVRPRTTKAVENKVKEIIIDSSSDSEVEDPLKQLTSAKDEGKSRIVTSSLHHGSIGGVSSSLHHDSSDAESLSDIHLLPLADRIGRRCPGTTSLPIKTKVSPVKDLRCNIDIKTECSLQEKA